VIFLELNQAASTCTPNVLSLAIFDDQVHLHAILASTATLLALLGCPPLSLLWTQPSAHVIIGFILIGLVMVEFGMGKYLFTLAVREEQRSSQHMSLLCTLACILTATSKCNVHMSMLVSYTQVLPGWCALACVHLRHRTTLTCSTMAMAMDQLHSVPNAKALPLLSVAAAHCKTGGSYCIECLVDSSMYSL
jgi:hypothetical protein